MNWKNERDLLIAQTLAFVQSVSGNTTDAAPKPDLKAEPDAAPSVEAAPVVAIKLAAEIADPPQDTQVDIHIPRTMVPGDIRAEMQNRIANFRAHQERFHRERAKYFSDTLARLRAKIETDSAPLR